MGKTAVSQTAEIFDMSALPKATNPTQRVVGARAEHAGATLSILPLEARRGRDLVDWMKARQRLGQIARLQRGWDRTNGVPPDSHTIFFAAQELAVLEKLGVPAPTINPSADGAVYADWHMMGLDIEIIFEAPYKVTVLIEDARQVVPSFAGEDVDLKIALEALRALCAR
jgi:hypothetical protein